MHRAKRAKRKIKAETEPPVSTQRIDRWLWHARVVKTRALAAALVASGHVRVNGRRIESAAYAVRRQDMLTVALPTTVRVLRAIEFADRRGNAAFAATLYEEVKP